jgi:hypothetical protein
LETLASKAPSTRRKKEEEEEEEEGEKDVSLGCWNSM